MIGKYIASRRKELDMSQKDLAAMLNVTAGAVSQWENGRTVPSASMFPKIADALSTTISSVFCEEQLADRIKILRSQQGLTQQEMADLSGISRVALARYENQTRLPTVEKMIMLADFFGVTVDYLIGRVNQEQKESAVVDLSGFDPELVEAIRDVRPEEKTAVLALISGLKASRKE